MLLSFENIKVFSLYEIKLFMNFWRYLHTYLSYRIKRKLISLSTVNCHSPDLREIKWEIFIFTHKLKAKLSFIFISIPRKVVSFMIYTTTKLLVWLNSS